MGKYTKINARTIDRRVDDGWEWEIQSRTYLKSNSAGKSKLGSISLIYAKIITTKELWGNLTFQHLGQIWRNLTFQHFGQLWLKSKLFIKLKFAVNK